MELIEKELSSKEASKRREMHHYFDELITKNKQESEHVKVLAGGLGLERYTERLKVLKAERFYLETALNALKREALV